MEEMEIPTEHLHEEINEKAEEDLKERKESWALYVALSTAFMAVLAAIAGLLSGHHVNEAMIDQIKSSDQWAFYQAKSIKSEIASSTDKILRSVSTKPVEDNKEVLARYEKEKAEIKASAEEHAKDSESHLDKHVTLSKAVTIFQIAIAISAISILTKRKILWYAAILLTLAGSVFLALGVMHG
ncbi:MAG TPA: DUF4337 domain-containing protein [Puia sp.]|jgi:hypothetical protein|nr:DUF4337 domain-containing protein [Puia sp.]